MRFIPTACAILCLSPANTLYPRPSFSPPLPPAQRLGKWGYLSLGLIAAPPCFLLPLLLQPKAEREKPFAQRYWVKVRFRGPVARGSTARVF